MSQQTAPRRRRPPSPWFGREQLWITLSLAVVMVATMFPRFNTFLGSRPGVEKPTTMLRTGPARRR